jgi:hypothetical protein
VVKPDPAAPPAPPAIAPGAPVIIIDVKPGGPVKPQAEPIALPTPVELAISAPVPVVALAPLAEVKMTAPVRVIATVPGMLIAPVVLADTIELGQKDFTHVSSSINDDGKTKTESLEATDKEGKNYKITKLNNAVTGLWVNGEEIPKEKYADYQSLIDRLDRARDNNWRRAQDRKLRVQEVRLHNLEIQQEKKWVMQEKRLQSEAFKIARAKNVDKAEMINKPDTKKYDIVLKQGFAAKEAKPYQPTKVELIARQHESRKLFLATSKRPDVLEARARKAAEAADELQHQKELMHTLVAEMVKDEIIKSEKRLESMGLNDTEMIVNGIKQPDDIQQKYRARYITRPGFGLFYGPVRMTGKGYFLGKGEL